MSSDFFTSDGRARQKPLRITLRIFRAEQSDKLPEGCETDREVYEHLCSEYEDLIRLAREHACL